MLKEILFALELGFKVIGIFLVCILVGFYLDGLWKIRPVCMLIGILIAFITVIQLLLGVGKHE